MIPNISRGDRMVGLVSYLAGPGRANEHTNPHVVAGSEGVMAWHANEQLDHDAALQLGQTLDVPREIHDAQMSGGHVWHCSLSLAATEGELGDEAWADIAQSFVHKMGFDTQEGTKAGMRWAAIHHGQSTNGNDHIHLAVQLVREDGTKADIGFDYSRAQQAARDLEREFGLVELETERSKVSEPGYSRAEYEATARRRAEAKYEATRHTEQLGWGELSKAERGTHVAAMKREIKAEGMPRETLKVEVRAAAAMADTEAEFVGKLYDHGMLIKPFYQDREQTIVGGYQVAMPSKYGEQPWYIAGGSLGHDLSLNRLRQQWDTSPELRQQAQHAWQQAGRNLAPDHAGQDHIDPAVLADQRQAIDDHFRQLRKIPLADRDRWAAEAQHMAGLMASWAKDGGPHANSLAQAARTLGRSASMKHQPQVPTRKQPWMRGAAMVLAQASSGGQGPAANIIMMHQVMQTIGAIAKVHEATHEARRARDIRASIEGELAAVQAAIPEVEDTRTAAQAAHAAAFPHSARQAAASKPSPMPSAMPQHTTSTRQPTREREGFER